MSLRRVIEHSIAATVSEDSMMTRRRQVKELTPAHVRLAAQSIDAAVFLIPTLKHEIDHIMMRRRGYRYIGSGAESRVYSDGTQVLKYVKGSELLSDHERKELSDKKQTEFEQLKTHMASFLLDQTIAVAPHIIKRGQEVVQTAQPYASYAKLIESNGPGGDMHLYDTTTDVLDELSDFVDASWDLHSKTGLLPDTNGLDNVVQTKNGLLLIDTQPITLDQAPIQAVVMSQLGSIATLLDRMS